MTENQTYLSGQNETIVAVSTPPGSGGIGIVRLSGPDAFNIGFKLFRPRSSGKSFKPQERRMYLGEITDPSSGIVIDEVMWVYFKAPRSFTTQDMVEIQCHGGSFSTNRIVELATGSGARMAQAGEFSCRAVLGGRLELAQAEAICKLIESKTENESSAALKQLQGKTSNQVSAITEKLVKLAAAIEVQIDFPDDFPENPGLDLGQELQDPLITLRSWIQNYHQTRVYFEGAMVVICGCPNVGKSSLFNQLLGRERNLVSAQPGTTRDVVEAEVVIRGIRCKLLDTAGIGEAGCDLEHRGMDMARETISRSDLVLEVIDASQGLLMEHSSATQITDIQKHLVVLNKCDLIEHPDQRDAWTGLEKVYRISALHGIGIDKLKSGIADALKQNTAAIRSSEMLLNRRQAKAIESALEALETAISQYDTFPSQLDLISLDVESAIQHLKQAQGLELDNDIIEQVFSDFCVGK